MSLPIVSYLARKAEEMFLVPIVVWFAVKLKRRSSSMPIVSGFAGEAEEMWFVLAERLTLRGKRKRYI